jgi:hypothetical protein
LLLQTINEILLAMNSSMYVSSAMRKQINLIQKRNEDAVNSLWYRAYSNRNFYVKNFYNKVMELLKQIDSGFSGYVSGTSFYIKSNKFGIYQGQSLNPDVASVDLCANKLGMRRKGATMVTKVIQCERELTPEKVVKYVLRFGMK